MLGFDLAEIYGYTTAAFNQQVKNNPQKFEGDDFCFNLTKDEFQILMSKKSISSWGGRRKLPRAFTESGVYMLMTMLKGELAVKQSRALIRAFRAMKDYIVESNGLLYQHDVKPLFHKSPVQNLGSQFATSSGCDLNQRISYYAQLNTVLSGLFNIVDSITIMIVVKARK